MLPNVRGLITTQDGASILFELRGRTIFEGDEPGRQNLVGWFESDHESYRWLNDLVCIAREGSRATGPDMVINVYAGIHEMSARSTATFFSTGPVQPEHRLFPAAADTAARIFAVAVVRLAQIRRERRV